MPSEDAPDRRRVAAGRRPHLALTPPAAPAIPPKLVAAVGSLTEREREVLALVVQGQTAKQIARALGVSPRTVETHRANLGAKLETDSLAQLIRRFAALVDETRPA